MRAIPPKGGIPPAVRQRRGAPARSTQRPKPTGKGPRTELRRRRAPYYPIKTWTFEEKPTFRRLPARLRVTRVHEPDVDVHDEVRQLVVIASLPGVKEQDMAFDVHHDIMTVEATRRDDSGQLHHYHREVLLPVEVHDDPIEVTFGNGLLQVLLKRKVTELHADKNES